ncbi:hypothetical protein OBBRIDRAFT_738300, partial [Obba rivulosa]
MSPKLNYDILCILTTYLRRRDDLLSFMDVSQVFFAAGLPSLLRNVTLNKRKDTKWLHDFMFADPATRFPHLRALHIVKVEAVLYGTSHVMEILRRAESLEVLSVAVSEKFLKMNSRAEEAICGLKSLKTLTLGNVGDATFFMLQQLNTPLESLSV